MNWGEDEPNKDPMWNLEILFMGENERITLELYVNDI